MFGVERLGLSGWTYCQMFKAGAIDLFGFIDEASELSVRYIEINDVFIDDISWPYLDKLRNYTKKKNVCIVQMLVDSVKDLASVDDFKRESSIVYAKQWIDIARYIGIESIRFNTGEGDLEKCIDSYITITDYAENKGLKVLIENHNGLSSDADSLKRIFDTVSDRSNALYFLFDTGNILCGELKPIVKYIDSVHLKSYGNINDLNSMIPSLYILESSGYKGYYFLEYDGSDGGRKILDMMLEPIRQLLLSFD